jgi:hypothetical protein
MKFSHFVAFSAFRFWIIIIYNQSFIRQKRRTKKKEDPRGVGTFNLEVGLKTDLREGWHIEIVRFWDLIICKTGVIILWDPRSQKRDLGHPAVDFGKDIACI